MEPLASTRDPEAPVAPAGNVRLINGIKVVESLAGAPLPEGVAWAYRCEIVEEPDCPPKSRPWILGASIAGIVGGMLATWLGFNWGFVPVPLACVGLWYGSRRGSTTVVRAEPDGRYLAFEDREPVNDAGNRAFATVAGVFVLALAGFPLFAEGGPDWYMTGAIVSFGIYLIYYGLTGQNLSSNEPIIPPASARFRAHADPRRPLDAASPITTDGEAHSSPRSGRS
jgi:hypothetical protein